MSSLTFYGWATTSTCRVIVSVFRRNRNDTVKLTKPRAKRMADTKARARRLRTMIYIYILHITLRSEFDGRFCMAGVRYWSLREMSRRCPNSRLMDEGCWNAFWCNIELFIPAYASPAGMTV